MSEIQSKHLSYQADGVTMQGYLAWDGSQSGPRPGVLVVHEFWGNNDYSRKRADMLAGLGYVALAVDMYGDGKQVETPAEASDLMNAVIANMPAARERFNAARDALENQPQVDAGRIAAVGYCFGGGVVLHMARFGADLKAVASFHGSLPLAVDAAAAGIDVTARVVAYNGEDDPFVDASAVAAFRQEMEQAGADYQLINYPGTVHGFSNPQATARGQAFDMPLRYNALADRSSWDHMQLLLNSAFGE